MEKDKRHKYTGEEKAEAVALAEEIGRIEASNSTRYLRRYPLRMAFKSPKRLLVSEEAPMKPISDETE